MGKEILWLEGASLAQDKVVWLEGLNLDYFPVGPWPPTASCASWRRTAGIRPRQ